jgi:hypothetical protein
MQPKISFYLKWLAVLPLMSLCGCVSSMALKQDFPDFSQVCSDASNQQLVLNLARLSQEDPIYFIQLGSFSSQYQFGTSAGFSSSSVRTDPITATPATGPIKTFVQNALTLGGSLNVSAQATPIFQYVPVTGSNLVQAVYTPINDKVYLTLFDQGYPADLIARTVIQSVQKQCVTNQYSVTNSVTNYQFLVNDPNDPTYPDFLSFCNDLRYAQLCHALVVDTVSSTTTIYSSTNSKLFDVASTAALPGLSVMCDDTNSGHVTVTQSQSTPKFVRKNIPENQLAQYMSAFAQIPACDTNFIYDTHDQNQSKTHAVTLATDITNGVYTIKTRTFESAMFFVANDDGYYKSLEAKPLNKQSSRSLGVTFTHDVYGSCAIITNKTDKSSFKVRPLMTLVHTNEAEQFPSFKGEFGVNYHGVNYSVGDVIGRQNRTVFTMINYLYMQTAIGTQSLPVQQLIQVQ